MKNRLFCLVIQFFLFLPVSFAMATPLKPVEGLEALRGAFAGTTDFTAEITQEKQLSLLRKKLVMKGIVRFKNPDRFYMEILPPYQGRTVLNDSVLEQRIGSAGELQRINLPPEQGLKKWFSDISKPIISVPEGIRVSADLTSGIYSVSIAPAKKGQLKEITIQFTPEGIIRKLLLEENSGDRTTIILKRLKRNVGLTNADFRLE